MDYNSGYYRSHYGRVLGNEPYFNLRALYWKLAITSVFPISENSVVLDYGCGTGQVSMAIPNTHFYDISEFSRDLIKQKGRIVYADNAEIPVGKFDFILSSHALEHSPRPFNDLHNFSRFAKKDGHLLLILPVERQFQKTLQRDDNNHLQCWTFQTISNLLHATGWKPLVQTYIYDSFGLGTLSKFLQAETAVSLSWKLGLLKRDFKSMMIVARNNNEP